jgi:hypothetical protein
MPAMSPSPLWSSPRPTWRPSAPTTAAEAYLALLGAVAGDPILSRRPAESPRAHGRRLRGLRVFASGASRSVDDAADASGTGPVAIAPGGSAEGRDLEADLALLVADWELVRYAERTLSAAEDRRGVARWRRLAAAVRARAGRPGIPGAGGRRGR